MTPEQAYQRGVECGRAGYHWRRYSFAYPPEGPVFDAYLSGWKHGLSLRDPSLSPQPGDVLLLDGGERAEVKSLGVYSVTLIDGVMSLDTFVWRMRRSQVLALGIPRST
jgi:hypothetical protein